MLFVPAYRDRGNNCHSCPPRELIPRVKSPQSRLLPSETAQHECTMPPGVFSLSSQSSSSDITASLAIQGRHASIISAASRIPLVRTKLAQPLPQGFTWARVSRLPQRRSPRHHLGTCHSAQSQKANGTLLLSSEDRQSQPKRTERGVCLAKRPPHPLDGRANAQSTPRLGPVQTIRAFCPTISQLPDEKKPGTEGGLTSRSFGV